ncbi:class-V pyridoxal-phosphate-dependent aminotransferase, NifS/IscS family [Hyphomonas neptunium ATCC 15444]|uniref:Cysteine desulfurase n=2 Tax=Hyphomonas TaxID=85 RepID=Q0BYY4_HYPNA|nr:class-V pyridoxal-phosphate-dependent aminotransferase, NifS/IscS family [Hyphomonas neptunium ATCC 15444]
MQIFLQGAGLIERLYIREVMIYADYNATAPLRPEARAAMLAAYELGPVNPSSVHKAGRAARAVVEKARAEVGAAIGSRAEDIVFTSGGTESLALAIQGAVAGLDGAATLIVSAIEHEAASKAAAHAGVPVETAYILPTGQVDLDDLRVRLAAWDRGLKGTPILVLMLANNETGILQPVAEAAALIREAGGLTVCDAVQGLGKVAVNVALLGVDYLALSAHKVGGPQGTGALWHRAGAPLKAVLYGGGQERGLRSGTENVAGIAGFGAAMSQAVLDLSRYVSLGTHRDAMEARLKAEGGVIVIGEGSPRLAGVSNFARAGFRAETQVMALDLAGVCISAGSACSSGKVKRSLVLMAMGADDALAESAIRTSFGWNSRPEDFRHVADAWLEAARRTVLKESV